MELVRTFADARSFYRGLVALVPTMGFFHEGHISLMRSARLAADTVVVSHFINPLQFNDPSDLERYPHDLERDMGMAEEAGADVLFAPPRGEMFPREPVTRVQVTGLTERMEGVTRPGHFTGVATVVTKLFAGLQPHTAYFGRKDGQQLAVLRRMTMDLSFPVTIVAHPTVREPDGLALSSRNIFLGVEDRPSALELSRGLMAAATAAEAGERDGRRLEDLVLQSLVSAQVEYVELVSQETLERLDQLDRLALLAVAARVGETRLIDNVAFDLVGGEVVADRGVRLDRTSVLYR